MDSPPKDACTFFGKHAYTGEEGFGMEYKYDLQFQGIILNILNNILVDRWITFRLAFFIVLSLLVSTAVTLVFS